MNKDSRLRHRLGLYIFILICYFIISSIIGAVLIVYNTVPAISGIGIICLLILIGFHASHLYVPRPFLTHRINKEGIFQKEGRKKVELKWGEVQALGLQIQNRSIFNYFLNKRRYYVFSLMGKEKLIEIILDKVNIYDVWTIKDIRNQLLKHCPVDLSEKIKELFTKENFKKLKTSDS